MILAQNGGGRSLETADDTVSDIAQACGFNDHSHFANAFRCARGRSPGAWRPSSEPPRVDVLRLLAR